MTKEQERRVLENKGLVYAIAKTFTSKYHLKEDLISYGMLGLCKASVRYEKDKGKFKDYASIYIDGHIKTALRDESGYIGSAKDRESGTNTYVELFTDYLSEKMRSFDGDSYTVDDIIEDKSINIEEDLFYNDLVTKIRKILKGKELEVFEALLENIEVEKKYGTIANDLNISLPLLKYYRDKIGEKIKKMEV